MSLILPHLLLGDQAANHDSSTYLRFQPVGNEMLVIAQGREIRAELLRITTQLSHATEHDGSDFRRAKKERRWLTIFLYHTAGIVGAVEDLGYSILFVL